MYNTLHVGCKLFQMLTIWFDKKEIKPIRNLEPAKNKIKANKVTYL